MLVHSYYRGTTFSNAFGTKGAKWGCYQCGNCVACPSIQRATHFHSSDGEREFKITQRIDCNSEFVVYYATCPCNYIYVGLTSRKLKVRVREHIHDIERAKDIQPFEVITLKPIARHFWKVHNCNSKVLKVKGIDKLNPDGRGGDLKQKLAQLEARWIMKIDSLQPKGLNEVVSFAPFL